MVSFFSHSYVSESSSSSLSWNKRYVNATRAPNNPYIQQRVPKPYRAASRKKILCQRVSCFSVRTRGFSLYPAWYSALGRPLRIFFEGETNFFSFFLSSRSGRNEMRTPPPNHSRISSTKRPPLYRIILPTSSKDLRLLFTPLNCHKNKIIYTYIPFLKNITESKKKNEIT